METAPTTKPPALDPAADSRPGDPCIMVLFGCGGDLTKRLLMPAIYNLVCDGLLPEQFAIIGADRSDMTTEDFRARLSDEKDGIKKYNTRKDFNPKVWAWITSRLHYVNTAPADGYTKVAELVKKLDAQYQARDNVLFYYAVPPSVFGAISAKLYENGFKEGKGWRRIIVEKPFGTDLPSAQKLNKEILSFWNEEQIYRVDHYLGKETVQNVLAFRFANEMFEPLWNKKHIDHVQLTVSEAVDVEGRGYYDEAGVLRDMIQNHMFQMLTYIAMEPPISFSADDIRNEKAKVLKAIRLYSPEAVLRNTVRGQYGAGKKADGTTSIAYREDPAVIESRKKRKPPVETPSTTETFAALRLYVDNWRWEGVPFYLRSGKALWKRGTDIVVQFKKAPWVLFRNTAVAKLNADRLIFHIQPEQSIELLFQAKTPGPVMQLQPVNMAFRYGESFTASRGTGYEVMIYSCMVGEATLFSRTDLVERAWEIAQPIMDAWAANPAKDFPNYAAGTWGPKAAYDLIEMDNRRRWYEIITSETLQRVPLFKGGDPLFLSQVSMALRPEAVSPSEVIVKKGDPGNEMYLLARGEAEVLDGNGQVKATLHEGDCFGEVALLLSEPRIATVRAKTACDLFVLEKGDFSRILRDHQQFAETIKQIARERYNRAVAPEQLMAPT
ncbi:MAG: glucose-6-phosphate dehydrogenase [Planctomycetes bacterium]|nr:glucose-6-phosphate dehydrogenase [Planctomycetota bacterium]